MRRTVQLSVLALYFISLTLSSGKAQFCDKDGCTGVLKKGHLKPFGEHRPPEGTPRTLKYAPSSADFYNKFIFERKPVVVRNGVSYWPAVKYWNNESYLIESFGSDVFNVEFRGKSFKSELPIRKPLTLREFLKIYKEEENVHLVSPFSTKMMLQDVFLPSFMNCDKISSKITSVNLLMSNGSTSAVFRRDGHENVLAVISGSKSVILINSSYTDSLYADRFVVAPGVLPFNPEKVDLETYNKLADVPYYEVTLHEGDVLYIPQYWSYHVRSKGSPNVGVNIWFQQFDFEDQFTEAGLSEDTNVIEVTEMFDKLVKEQPDTIQCQGQTVLLTDAMMKFNLSELGHYRIPHKNQRPEDVTLASGFTMPVFGFGTAFLMDTLTAVKTALDTGYRLFDTAQGYPNSEKQIAEAIAQSGVPRSEIFIITKLHPRFLGYETTIDAVEMSLKELKMDYIDLYLIHSQSCDSFLLSCKEGEPKGTWQESWKAMEEMHRRGKLRSLGVSNYDVKDLEELVELATVPVSAVQNLFDPFHQDRKVRAFCQQHSIRYIGFSTLGASWVYHYGLDKNPVLTSRIIEYISGSYEFVPSQIVLRWAIHVNVTVIPRSKNPRNIQLNFRALDFSLKQYEINFLTNITLHDYHPLERNSRKKGCKDSHEDCSNMAATGECLTNTDWMLINCQISCEFCYVIQESGDEATKPKVFVGSEDHYMYAIDENGAVSWKFMARDKIHASAVFNPDGGMLYFGSTDGFVYALEPLSGKLVWTFQTKGAVIATPQVSKVGVLYFGSHDNHFYALDAKNGSLIWKKDLQCAFWGGAALEEQKKAIYTGCVLDELTQDMPRVFALSLETGDIIWRFETAGNVYSSPALSKDGSTVFFASLDYRVYALDSGTGEQLWAYNADSKTESSPVVSVLDGTLYIGLIKGQLIALNTLSGPLMGTLKWKVDTGAVTVSSPVITDAGKIFIGTGDGRILAVNQTDGTIIWASNTSDHVVTSVTVSRKNVVYGTSTDKNIFALNGDDGSVIWSYNTGAAVIATPAIAPEWGMPSGP